MVMKMNKTKFIQELCKRTKLEEEKCTIVNSILEDNFLIGKQNKEKVVNSIIEKLDIETTQAEKIYETAMDIIAKEIKYKIRHPFKSQD